MIQSYYFSLFDCTEDNEEGILEESTESYDKKQRDNRKKTAGYVGKEKRVSGPGRKKDWAWEYYIRNDEDDGEQGAKAKCKFCSTLISARHVRLSSHLETKHPLLLHCT